MNIKKFFLLFSIFLFLPSPSLAATLYLDPAQGKIGPDDVIEVKVKIGVDVNECVNAAQIGLSFPNDVLEVKDFNSGESIISLWIDKPEAASLAEINQKGMVSFSGGIPGGYCGRIPGDPGDSNIIGSVIFTPKKPILFHKAAIDFAPDNKVLLNDGRGTEAQTSFQGAVLEVDEKMTEKKDEWAQKIDEDNVPPEPFIIEIGKDKRMAGDRYVAMFFTADKQTGVDHYEVLEVRPSALNEDQPSNAFIGWLKRVFKIKGAEPLAWERAVSPYVLKDQDLKSVIRVKAIDRAGNERISEYDNVTARTSKAAAIIWPLALVGALVVVLAVIFLAIRIVKRKKDKNGPGTPEL